MIQAVSHVQLGVSLWLRCFTVRMTAHWNPAHSALMLPEFPTITTDGKNLHLLEPRVIVEGGES